MPKGKTNKSYGITTILGRTGIEDRTLFCHKSGIYYRDKTCDLMTVRECLSNYAEVRVKDRVVLDLGANIGGFSWMALQGGAKKVISIEPDVHSFKVLEKNCPGALTMNAAVTHDDRNPIPFYVGGSGGGPSIATTAKPIRGRDMLFVRGISFDDLLKHKPTTVKIDIEGGEWKLLPLLPSSVTEFAIELHGEPYTSDGLLYQTKNAFKDHWEIISESSRRFYGKLCMDLVLRR